MLVRGKNGPADKRELSGQGHRPVRPFLGLPLVPPSATKAIDAAAAAAVANATNVATATNATKAIDAASAAATISNAGLPSVGERSDAGVGAGGARRGGGAAVPLRHFHLVHSAAGRSKGPAAAPTASLV